MTDEQVQQEQPAEAAEEPKKDDVIDADFQEVDEGDKKKRA